MPKCIKLKQRKEQACIASMRFRIKLFLREIEGIKTDTVDFGENFINEREVWASLDTTRGTQFFDDNNILKRTTHRFIIRFIPGVTFEDFVVFKNLRYRVLFVENVQETDTFYKIDCVIRGDDTLPVTEV